MVRPDKTAKQAPAAADTAKGRARGAGGVFPMRVAAQLSGLTPDTIRAWERRYGAVEPMRTAGNTRQFTRAHVRRLLLLREATEAGHSIGNIAGLSDEALEALEGVHSDYPPAAARPAMPAEAGAAPSLASPVVVPDAALMDAYFEPLARFDAVGSAAWLRRAATLRAPRAFVLDVVSPLLASLRERRADARLGGPHVALARTQLTGVLDALLEVTDTARGAPATLTVGPPHQRHAIGAMASALLSRHHGYDALFLGGAVPDADTLWAVDTLGVSTVVFDMSVPMSLELADRSRGMLARMGRRVRLWVMVPTIGALNAPPEGTSLADLAEVDRAFAALPRGGSDD